ncbi:DNA-binding transcriptional regulator, AcrR family [Spirosomataceae bacterium TFI 002]|nr:DNA-binding transcriptional regulator, AcrR family [Spirosomataceae bacterium TFI 002]
MTSKKENILNAALELFALEGYYATSTSAIAKKAGVSEGLIFRHFKNKEGLLEAIFLMGEEQVKVIFADIVLEIEPKKVIEKVIDIANEIASTSESYRFWKLQYKIKWETESYHEEKMLPVLNALKHAFETLGYEDPNSEAALLLQILDGIATRLFLQQNFDLTSALSHLKVKYKV